MGSLRVSKVRPGVGPATTGRRRSIGSGSAGKGGDGTSPVRTSPVQAGAAVLYLFLLASCTVGPRYAPPPPPAPSGPGFVSSTPATTSSAQPPAAWWRLYETPALDQLVQEALTHNNDILAAAANLAQARAALSQARAGLYPATNLSAGAQYGVSSDAVFANEILHPGSAASPGPTYSAGLDVSWEIDLFGRVRRAIEAARADVESRQAAEDVTRVSVAGETTRAYVDACAYAQELTVARQSLAVAEATLDITVKRATDGTATNLDVARAREQVAQVRATLPTYEGQRRTALFQLAVFTGRPPEEISQAADACTAPPRLDVVLPAGDIQSLFRRRPDVRQAERQLAGDVARIGVVTADLYPTINIAGTVATAASSLSGLGAVRNLAYAAGPLLNWTFPNTLVAQAQIREARAVASASYANFQATVLQALQDTETALTTYANELDRNAALVNARDQSRIAFDLAKTQYDLGRISYFDLLTEQNDLLSANATLASSDQALASDQVTVFKALGGGWEQAPVVQPLPIRDARTGHDTPTR
jgi:NodT family efflux transporter outer membrane factor (OMF) lipoprotein